MSIVKVLDSWSVREASKKGLLLMAGPLRGERGGKGPAKGWAKVLHTDIQTYRHTYKPSDEAGPRGAFAPKNLNTFWGCKRNKSGPAVLSPHAFFRNCWGNG